MAYVRRTTLPSGGAWGIAAQPRFLGRPTEGSVGRNGKRKLKQNTRSAGYVLRKDSSMKTSSSIQNPTGRSRGRNFPTGTVKLKCTADVGWVAYLSALPPPAPVRCVAYPRGAPCHPARSLLTAFRQAFSRSGGRESGGRQAASALGDSDDGTSE